MRIPLRHKTLVAIKATIKGTEYENKVFVVGGFVRDLILGKESNDIDLLVEGDINAGIDFARWFCQKMNIYKSGSNPVEYGLYGTAMLHYMGEKIECVAPRSEKYKDGSRNPEVESCTIKDDCFRRDFTINSMFINVSTEELLDLSGMGLKDIKEQTICSTSEPDIIFKQDPLRMLRCIRFASRFGWGIEKDTWFGIIKNCDSIKTISQERINDEINKMLVGNKPSEAIGMLLKSNLLDKVLPDVYLLNNITQNKYHSGNAFEHTMAVVDKSLPLLVNRLSALYHDIGKLETRTETNGEVHFYSHEDIGAYMVEAILKGMKYPNETIRQVKLVTKNHMRLKGVGDKIPSNKAMRKLQSDLGDDLYLVLDIIDADNKSHADEYCINNQVRLIREKLEEMDAKGESCTKIVLPINGNDICKEFGLKPCPKVGKLLDILKEKYLEKPDITKNECFEIIEEELIKM